MMGWQGKMTRWGLRSTILERWVARSVVSRTSRGRGYDGTTRSSATFTRTAQHGRSERKYPAYCVVVRRRRAVRHLRSCETLGKPFCPFCAKYGFGAIVILLDKTNRWKSMESSKSQHPILAPAQRLGLSCPSRSSYFAAISSTPGKAASHSANITEFDAHWSRKAIQILHKSPQGVGWRGGAFGQARWSRSRSSSTCFPKR